MTRFSCFIFLFIVIYINTETRAASSRFKYNRKNIKINDELKNKQSVKCNELSVPILNNILGPAFNSRCVRSVKMIDCVLMNTIISDT